MKEPRNFVMISPHFPHNFETFAHRLRELGFNVLGIADAPYDALSEGLKSALTEYYRVEDMNDYEQMYRAVAFFAHKYGRIDRIESHNEHWLALDAKLRTDFNVFGYKEDDMESIKTKSKMKEIFKKIGLKVAQGKVVHNAEEAKKYAKQFGFPVVVKPNAGVGASDTYKLHNMEELETFLQNRNPNVSYIMEEFIQGDIVTFDGLTDRDGNIVFYSSLEYSETVLDTVSQDSDMYYYVTRDIAPDLVKMGEKCVQAFNIRERFFHFEFFRRHKNKELLPLEINCRPPGGLTIDMWNYADDFDIFREYASVVKNNRFNADVQHAHYVVYIARKANKSYAHTIEEVQERFGEQIIAVQEVPGVFSRIMGEQGIVARTKTREEMKALADFAQEKQ